MRELSFMGPSNDGKRLLLVAEDGTQFELPVDSRLVAVVSREHGTTSVTAPQAEPGTMPTPREIQDQVRHGATVEEIATAAGVSTDDVAKFAYPVITERAHIADQAREALVRVGTEHIPLESAVLARVMPRAVDPRLIRWDAWRVEGANWTVIAAYPANQGERTATFTYNSADKSISASDEQARWMLEIGETATPTPPQATTVESARPRPHVVPSAPAQPPTTPAAPAEQSQGSGPSGASAESTQARSWDRAHPAARAHERREANGDSRTPAQQAEASAAARVNPEHPAGSSQPQPDESIPQAEATPVNNVAKESSSASKEETPQWEELLFGSPQNEDPS